MTNLDFNIQEYLEARRNLIDVNLKKYFSREIYPNFPLYNSMKYSLLSKAKRLRPILCLAASELKGGDYKNALRCACAIEYIHTYSLIHDDLPSMDNDNFRRGQPTNHKVFGEATAILAGDALLTESFNLIAAETSVSSDKLVRIVKTISNAAGYYGMVYGQQMDILSDNVDKEIEYLLALHSMKTGALITASILCGGIIGDLSEDELLRLNIFGENIGLAFQIIDDILDVEGSDELGKDKKSDIKNQRLTILSFLPSAKAKEKAKTHLNNAICALDIFRDNALPLIEIAKYIVERNY